MFQGVLMQNFIFTNICNYTVTKTKTLRFLNKVWKENGGGGGGTYASVHKYLLQYDLVED